MDKDRIWLTLQPVGLKATAGVLALAAGIGLVSSVTAATGQAPSLGSPFLMAGGALALASALTWWGLRPDIVELVLGGLAAGAFGISLAEMSAQAATIPDHYMSLWIPMALSALLLAQVVFRDGQFSKQSSIG